MRESIENNKKTFKKYEKGTNRVSYGNGFQNIPNFTYYDEFNEEFAGEFANNSDFSQKQEYDKEKCCHESRKENDCCTEKKDEYFDKSQKAEKTAKAYNGKSYNEYKFDESSYDKSNLEEEYKKANKYKK